MRCRIIVIEILFLSFVSMEYDNKINSSEEINDEDEMRGEK